MDFSSMFLSASFGNSKELTMFLRENLLVLQTSAHKIENIISKSGDLNLPAEKSLGDTSKVRELTCSDEVVELSYDDLISPTESAALPGMKKMKELVTW